VLRFGGEDGEFLNPIAQMSRLIPRAWSTKKSAPIGPAFPHKGSLWEERLNVGEGLGIEIS